MSVIKRHIYLDTLPIADALEKMRAALQAEGQTLRRELVPSHLARNRVLAEAVYASQSAPPFHCAAMDGFAVRACDTFAARPGYPLQLTRGTQAFAVNTGNPLPPNCDAVLMIERVQCTPSHIRIEEPCAPYQHVRRAGEDIVSGELLFPCQHQIRAYDVGALLSAGIWEVPVWEQLKVRIIPTGDEVLDFMNRPSPQAGQVVESNAPVLALLAEECGCLAERIPPVQDTLEALHAALRSALSSDVQVVIFCAGSSAGSKDFTRACIEQEGRIIVHGIAAMPGKPSILGLCQGRLVVGAPGYPVSSLVCFEELVAPLLAWLSKREPVAVPTVPVILSRPIPSRLGMEEFVRVVIGKVDKNFVATPLGRGASMLNTACKAHGIIRIPRQSEGLVEETPDLHAELRVPQSTLERTLVCVGSHDNALDILTDELMCHDPAFVLCSAHVGSMGGIEALKQNTCLMAGMHLFDPQNNRFNRPFLDQYLPNSPITLINMAYRQQGLIVAAGNPLMIRGIADLPRVRFVNRQRGSGTRILFDRQCALANLRPENIQGYDHEEFTHMAVAMNIAAQLADCTMGIRTAAQAFHLDFIPICQERYDLAIPTRFLTDPRIIAVRAIIESPQFRTRLTKLGGYDCRDMGKVME